MNPPLPSSRLAAAAVLALTWLLTACNTTAPTAAAPAPAAAQNPRITEYKADYDALPATTQKQLADGLISQGQNMKLVYVALGRPDRIVITPDGKSIIWTYQNYIPPVINTSRTVVGAQTKPNFSQNNSPLHDSLDAWNNNVLKHEVPYSPQGSDMSKWEPQIVRKAPTQSWAEYGKYRSQIDAVKGRDAAASTNPEVIARLKNIAKEAEIAYQEALTIPVIASPDPLKLEIIFFDHRVVDAIVDDSFSAFSSGPLPLSTTAVPGVSSQPSP